MAKILVVEDGPLRKAIFATLLKQYNVVFASSSSSAIEKLKNGHYDVLFLDHDLMMMPYSPSRWKNTGAEVARHIRASGKRYKGIVLHSMNSRGVQVMAALLRDSAEKLIVKSFPDLVRSLMKEDF